MTTDPHHTDGPLFECVDCGHRIEGKPENRRCPRCGGYLQNIGIARSE